MSTTERENLRERTRILDLGFPLEIHVGKNLEIFLPMNHKIYKTSGMGPSWAFLTSIINILCNENVANIIELDKDIGI